MARTYEYVDSPLGPLLVAGRDAVVELIGLPSDTAEAVAPAGWVRAPGSFPACRRQLGEYFDGARRQFDLALAPHGTPFQLAVWRALADIPYGTTMAYRDLAARIGRPRAVRAVGLANGRNPLPIVLPCHRVIGHDGSLVGYGGGLEAKRFLLALEGVAPWALLDGRPDYGSRTDRPPTISTRGSAPHSKP